MDEQRDRTPFEQAFFAYHEAQGNLEYNEREIAGCEKRLAEANRGARACFARRAEALAELKRHMTPKAFAELTADKAVML